MKKIIVLLLVICLKTSVCQSQQILLVKCNAPTCEEPGDPGLTTASNNQLVVTWHEEKKNVSLALNNFFSNEVNVGIFNTTGKCLRKQIVKIDKPTVEVFFNLIKETAGHYIINVVSSDRVYTTDLAMR